MRTSILVLAAIFFSCNDGSTANSSKGSSAPSSEPPPIAVQTDFTKDTLFTVAFPKDSSAITVTGRLAGINMPVTVLIPVTRGSTLSAVLVPDDSVANIRFNRVFMPNGKADGPFGRAVNVKIRGEGSYKLVIGENLMQGEEWKGRFALSISVK